jgi:hypothetical protein
MGMFDRLRSALMSEKLGLRQRPEEDDAIVKFSKTMLESEIALEDHLNQMAPLEYRQRGAKVYVSVRLGSDTVDTFKDHEIPGMLNRAFDLLDRPKWLPDWRVDDVTQHADRDIHGGHDITASALVDAIRWQELDAIIQICGAFLYMRKHADARYVRQPDADAAISRALRRAEVEEPPRYRRLLDYLIIEGAIVPHVPQR